MTNLRFLAATAAAALVLAPASALAVPLVIDGSVTTNTCPGGIVRDGGRSCEYGGVKTFDYIDIKNGGVLYVTKFDGADKVNTGNLVLKATGLDPTNSFSIHVDKQSRIKGKGAGYQGKLCDNGPGPASFPLSGGRGGCAVRDSGGGGGHFGPGGRGTKDNPNSFTPEFPGGYEEDCGSLVNPAMNACVSYTDCRNNDGLPSVAGQAFWHSIYDTEFGTAGGDKGCRDGDGFTNGAQGNPATRAGAGGGRIVLFAATAAQNGVVLIEGRVSADGNRGCAQGNDSAGGGAGGTILIVGDLVKVASTGRVSAHGGHGGDGQIKCLPCNVDSDCHSTDVYQNGGAFLPTGQTCQSVTDPASGVTTKRCGPCNCTPCTSNADCDPILGQTCKTLPGLGAQKYCADATNQCTPFDPGDDEAECAATQNIGTCDDCGGGGGGGLINIQSRVPALLDPLAIFDVRGAIGGICPICAGEAGGGIGEIQLDSAYVGEICDGFDNDFNGAVDDGLPLLSCGLPSCVGGVPQTCPVDPTTCTVAAKDASPRFALIVDTSGSMLNDVSGNPLFGDGSNEFPAVATGNPPKLFTAKKAVSDVIAAFPENGYALARYHQDVGINRSCQTASNFECALSCCSYDNPTDNVAPLYPTTYPGNECLLAKLYPGAGYPSTPTFTGDLPIGWPPPGTNDCINYAGTCGPPRRGAQFLVGFDQPLKRYLSWLDNHETNFQETQNDPEGAHCVNGDCELRATGETPLAGALQATADYLSPIIACDGAKACRKYATILLTDGAESCQGDPVAAAAALLTNGVKTYVIGFSVLPTEKAQLNAIATAGGTNAAQFTGGTDAAFFATTEQALADALASIISSSQVFEKCNGIDDNCNNLVDEGFPDKGQPCDNGKLGICKVTGAYVCTASGDGTVCSVAGDPGPAPQMEVCNGLDDNCNGQIDEGLNCPNCIPSPEVCNGKDDDCDGMIDEPGELIDTGKPCGSNVGICTKGTTVCSNGMLACQGGTGPMMETCNGKDDDCDGIVDGISQSCYDGPSGTEGVGICQGGQQKCTNGTFGPCQGEVVPTKEKCNGLDDDCNGKVDDIPGLGMKCCPFNDAMGKPECGVGQCQGGVLACTMTSVDPVCQGAVGPSPEICDGIDNDCNGKVDDLPGGMVGGSCCPSGLCGVGVCKAGTLACGVAGLECDGAVNPTAEKCNNLDDDCNGMVDDIPGLGQPCCPPGANCGVGVCKFGTLTCDPSMNGLVCTGSTGAMPETCNGQDDDCNGIVDDVPGAGEPCCPPGSPPGMAPDACNKGVCMPGIKQCVMGSAALECVGGKGPGPEVCNGLDDDCNGKIDDGDLSKNDPSIGKACDQPKPPQDKAPCKAGMTVCVGGKAVCEGAVQPGMEICDGIDNDCDGKTDQGNLCGQGQACIDAMCRTACKSGEFPCPGGEVCMGGFCVPSGAGGSGGSGGSGGGGKAGAGGSNSGGAGGSHAGTSSMGGGATGEGGAGGSHASGGQGNGGSSHAGNGAGGASGAAGSSQGPTPNPDATFGLPTGGGGCACETAGSRDRNPWALAVFAGLALVVARRRGGDR